MNQLLITFSHPGCTRDSFNSKTVTHLSYTTYPSLALKTLFKIARFILAGYELTSIAITHRLGRVDIGEESILIAVSAPHRKAAWEAGEECLERVKEKVEIWKEEWFEDGGVWRSNRDGQAGVPVSIGGEEAVEEAPQPGIKKVSTGEFSEGGLEF
jgi:molybdopterin synthase catalytic subunit